MKLSSLDQTDVSRHDLKIKILHTYSEDRKNGTNLTYVISDEHCAKLNMIQWNGNKLPEDILFYLRNVKKDYYNDCLQLTYDDLSEFFKCE